MASPSHIGTSKASQSVRTKHVVEVVARTGMGLAILLVGAAFVLIGLTWSNRVEALTASHLQDALLVLGFLLYSAVGAVVLSRRPGNRVGGIFLSSGLLLLLWIFSFRYATYGLMVRPGSLPGAEAAAWLGWTVIPGFGLAFTFLLLVFPDGRLPSPSYRAVAWFAGVAVAFTTTTWATLPGPLDLFGQVINPVGISAVERLRLNEVGWGLLLLAVLASAASLIIRYVHSTGTARRQLQWFAYAAALVGLTWLTITIATDWAPAWAVAEVMLPVAVAALPIAAFVAIFKHDLYDLGVVVSKTITFGVLAALITIVYVGLVVGVGSAVGGVGEPNLFLAILATALVAVAFQPVRARVQALAARLVYGERANPYEVLAEFAHRMGETVNPERALPEVARLLGEATDASRTGLWLVVESELRRVAAWPDEEDRSAVRLVEGRLPPLPDASDAVEVRHQDRLLGAITLTVPLGRELAPIERRLVTDLAAQAGLVLDNLRLIEELKASRQRIVTAQDQERRRLERDIHDGVQQRLLALALRLRTEAEATEPELEVGGILKDAADEARDILTEVRRLARGIHPAIVTEGGLVAALESLSERSPIPTEVRSPDIGRLPEPVDVTIYYLVAEALANVTKHAQASEATVTVERVNGRIRVEVTDDGIGGAVASGPGLTGLADRVAALAGQLEVESPPGGGTRLRAEIPCGSS